MSVFSSVGSALTGALGSGDLWTGALTGLASSAYDAYRTNSANKHAKRAAQQQQAWTKSMSDTAHQREVADLRAAGLNPILSATGGQGAYFTGGAEANTKMGSLDPVATAVNSAREAKRLRLEDDMLKNTVRQTAANITNQTRDSEAYSATQLKLKDLYEKQIAEISARLPAVKAEAEKDKSEAEADKEVAEDRKVFNKSSLGTFLNGFGFGMSSLLPVLNSATSLAKVPANIQNLRSDNRSYHYGNKKSR